MEDFLTEADILCSHWKIETPVGIEDGRPFTYEVESIHHSKFHNQAKESSLPPYEGLYYFNEEENVMKPNEVSDEWSNNMAMASGYFEKSKDKQGRIDRLRRADWLEHKCLYPKIPIWQRTQTEKLKNASPFLKI